MAGLPRAKKLRRLAFWIHSANSAGKQQDVELFVGVLESMKATPAEIRRAVRVLMRSGKVKVAQS